MGVKIIKTQLNEPGYLLPFFKHSVKTQTGRIAEATF